MTIGFRLGSLTQSHEESSNSFDQEGQMLGTYWDLSVPASDPDWDQHRDSFGKTQLKQKKVTFSKETLAAYKAKQQKDNKQEKGRTLEAYSLNSLGPTTNNNLGTIDQEECSNRLQQLQ